jgi:hypothetical protein
LTKKIASRNVDWLNRICAKKKLLCSKAAVSTGVLILSYRRQVSFWNCYSIMKENMKEYLEEMLSLHLPDVMHKSDLMVMVPFNFYSHHAASLQLVVLQ